MRYLSLLLIFIVLPIEPLFTHGYSDNCSEECIDYYCPPDYSKNIKQKDKESPSEEWDSLFTHVKFIVSMSFDQIKKFLIELKSNKSLLEKVSNVATANEIALIASDFGFQFTGKELKEISKSKIEGVNIKMQDTTPSYNFGEGGN